MYLGDFDLEELRGANATDTRKAFVDVLFFALGLLVQVVFLNLLVGILGARYGFYAAKARH